MDEWPLMRVPCTTIDRRGMMRDGCIGLVRTVVPGPSRTGLRVLPFAAAEVGRPPAAREGLNVTDLSRRPIFETPSLPDSKRSIRQPGLYCRPLPGVTPLPARQISCRVTIMSLAPPSLLESVSYMVLSPQ